MHDPIRSRRLSAAALLVALAGVAVAGPPPDFSDVARTHWARESIDQVAQAGILEGYAGKFHGEKLINRYQMAVILDRVLDTQKQVATEAARAVLASAPPALAPQDDGDLATILEELARTTRELELAQARLAETEAGYTQVRRMFRTSRYKPW